MSFNMSVKKSSFIIPFIHELSDEKLVILRKTGKINHDKSHQPKEKKDDTKQTSDKKQVIPPQPWVEDEGTKLDDDLYSHIHNLYNEDIGVRFVIASEDYNKQQKIIRYTNKQKEKIDVTIMPKALVLFKSGLGLYEYEIDCANNEISDIDQKKFVELLYNIKEVAYNKTLLQTKTEIISKDKPINDGKSTDEEEVKPIGPPNDIKYKISKYVDFRIGDWILEKIGYIDNNELKPSFFQPKGKEIKYPDKAILFNYFTADKKAFDTSRRELVETLVYITHGYKESYKLNDSIEEDFFKPYANIWWNASQEGCSCMAITGEDEDTNNFLEQAFTSRMEAYYQLYILVLQQYYGLLIRTKEIAELPSTQASYKQKSTQEKVRNNLAKTNLFLMNNVFSEVSNITHQNRYYEYIMGKFHVHSFMKEIKEEMDAVNGMVKYYEDNEKERHNRIIDIGLSIISLLAVVSAGIDALSFVDRIRDAAKAGYGLNVWHFVALAIILLITIVFVFLILRELIKARNEE